MRTLSKAEKIEFCVLDLIVRSPGISQSTTDQAFIENALKVLTNSLTTPLAPADSAVFYYLPTETPFYNDDDRASLEVYISTILESGVAVNMDNPNINHDRLFEQRERFYKTTALIRHMAASIIGRDVTDKYDALSYICDRSSIHHVLSPDAYQRYLHFLIATDSMPIPIIQFSETSGNSDYAFLFECVDAVEGDIYRSRVAWLKNRLIHRGFILLDTSIHKHLRTSVECPMFNYYILNYSDCSAYIQTH